jgi:oxalate---CoA ligase
VKSESVFDVIRVAAEERPEAVALAAPGRSDLSYQRLWRRIEETVAELKDFGLGEGSCIATALPDGPEAAVALLSIASYSACTPISPALQPGELECILRILGPRAILVARGGTAARVANSLGITVIEVSPTADGGEAGAFRMSVRFKGRVSAGNLRHNAALILPTSGTTSRPKLVMHTQRSLYWATRYLGDALHLSPDDRCLNLAPLPYSLGMTGGLLASIGNGGSTVCLNGFRLRDFFSWLDQFQPTWYAAVPAIHESIVDAAGDHQQVVARSRLRFVRSAGARLSPLLKEEMQRVMRCPLIEAYGMSEVPPITMDPLPPARRKAGSAGIAAGTIIQVSDEAGNSLPSGETGEILVRGLNVAQGYWNNPAANREGFINGWFRTGDLGYVDEDGFLFLTGRIKELINRGGEKIPPSEVDQALMEHAAVARAITFPVPDDKLGQEVGSAVILRENMSASVGDLQAFVASRLSPYKVPRYLVFVREFPLGPTGKVSRAKLGQSLGPELAAGRLSALSCETLPWRTTAPAAGLHERLIAPIWARVLGIEEASVGVHDNFFDCGGDSIRGAELLAEVSVALGLETPPPSILLIAPTLAALARVIDDPRYLATISRIAPIQTRGEGTPLFCISDGLEFRHVTPHLDGLPVFGLRLHNFEDDPPPLRIEDLAARCRETLQSVQPHGPYMLGGWCFGGVVAFELARQLEASGEEVSMLALFDSRNLLPTGDRGLRRLQNSLHVTGRKMRYHLRNSWGRGLRRGAAYAWQRTQTVGRRCAKTLWSISYRLWARANRPLPALLRSRNHAQSSALSDYLPKPVRAPIVFFVAAERPPAGCEPQDEWSPWSESGVALCEIPGDHVSMFQEPGASLLAAGLRDHLDSVRSKYHRGKSHSVAV